MQLGAQALLEGTHMHSASWDKQAATSHKREWTACEASSSVVKDEEKCEA